jgi:Spy/CpxP family protein refolding chaperone
MRTLQTAIVLAITLLIAIPGITQEKQKKKKGRKTLSPTARLMIRMQALRNANETLALTTEQQGQLENVREELRPTMTELFEDLQAILTAEQRTAAEDAMRAARDAGKEGRAFAMAVESAVKFTDEQKEKMAPIDKRVGKLQRQMMKKVNGILTPEQREKLAKQLAPKRKNQGDKKAGNKKKSQ